ncbi:MAG: hypothetical protein COA99_05180 [Moraxellaceae bacterium]|nr:MAG: hypothetical protein COA99_05180 [Moraxellaceae bacterium]
MNSRLKIRHKPNSATLRSALRLFTLLLSLPFLTSAINASAMPPPPNKGMLKRADDNNAANTTNVKSTTNTTTPSPTVTSAKLIKQTPLQPLPFNAQYDVSLNGSNQLEGSRVLSQSGENEFTLVYKASHFLFKIKEVSKFRWKDGSLVPLYYESKRSHLFGSTRKSLTFDWPKGVANFYYKEKDGSFELEPSAIDPLSTLFVVSTKIQQGMTDITILETEDNDIEARHYTMDGTEILNTQLGPLKTVKATLHDKETANVWFAIDLNYLVVKLRHKNKGGDIFELNIRGYDGPKIDRPQPINVATDLPKNALLKKGSQ